MELKECFVAFYPKRKTYDFVIFDLYVLIYVEIFILISYSMHIQRKNCRYEGFFRTHILTGGYFAPQIQIWGAKYPPINWFFSKSIHLPDVRYDFLNLSTCPLASYKVELDDN